MKYLSFFITIVCCAPFTALAQQQDKKPQPPFAVGFAKLQAEMNKLQALVGEKYQAAKTEKAKEAVIVEALRIYRDKGGPLADQAIKLVRPHAKDPAAVEVLAWVLTYQFNSKSASDAADLLIKHHAKDPKTRETASRFVNAPMPWTEKLLRAIAAADLPLDDRAAALFNVAQCVQAKSNLPSMLDTLDANMKKVMVLRYGKKYLNQLQAQDPVKVQEEAVKLYKTLEKKYGLVKYGFRNYGEAARSAIYEIKNLSIGRTAPDIAGEDIDGAKFKLSDYRGKVVVLEFWGHW